MPTTFTIPSIFTAVDRFSAPLRGMSMATNSFAARSNVAIARVERGFRSLMTPLNSLKGMLNNIGYYVGIYTFIRAIKGAYDVVADFQQAQVDISAVTGKSVRENRALADQARSLSLRYGEAAKSVLALDLGLIKLGYSQDQVLKMSEAVMTASIALKATPDELGKKIGAILQAFKIPETATQDVADLLSKAADLSALDWSDLSTMLPTAMQSAALAWGDVDPLDQFKRLLALFATVRNAQVHVASGATGIKNMLVDAGIRGKDYQDMIQQIIESPNQLKKAYKLFGRRTLVSALPVAEAQKMGGIEDFIDKLNTQSPGYAMKVASQRLVSLRGIVQLLGTAYDEFILSLDSGEGKLSKAFMGIANTARTMLLLAAGTEQANQTLRQMPSEVISSAQSWLNFFSVLWTVIKAFIILKAILIATRVVTMAMTAGQWLLNAALMVTSFLNKKNLLGMFASIRGLFVYNIATRQMAIAQTLLNVAMYASPLIVFAIGILAIVGVMKLMSNWTDKLISGITGYSDALSGANDGFQKFYMNNEDMFSGDDAWKARMMNPALARQYDLAQTEKANNDYLFGRLQNLQPTQEGQFVKRVDRENPRAAMQENMGFRQANTSGTIKLEINDKGGYVKNVETDNKNIMPKVTGTNQDWYNQVMGK